MPDPCFCGLGATSCMFTSEDASCIPLTIQPCKADGSQGGKPCLTCAARAAHPNISGSVEDGWCEATSPRRRDHVPSGATTTWTGISLVGVQFAVGGHVEGWGDVDPAAAFSLSATTRAFSGNSKGTWRGTVHAREQLLSIPPARGPIGEDALPSLGCLHSARDTGPDPAGTRMRNTDPPSL